MTKSGENKQQRVLYIVCETQRARRSNLKNASQVTPNHMTLMISGADVTIATVTVQYARIASP
jgi:hypothetical protein